MADIQELFKELAKLKPEEAGELKDLLKANLAESQPEEAGEKKPAKKSKKAAEE